MGVIKFFSQSSQDKRSFSVFDGLKSKSRFDNNAPYAMSDNNVSLPNPSLDNYTIVKSKTIGNFLAIKIKYHDCINYEGQKIMVYNCTLDDLKKQKLIDPHFCNNKKYLSPIARFEPTKEGWDNAILFCNILKNK